MPLFQVRFRTDTTAQWAAENPVLLRGEMGLEEGPDGPDGAVGSRVFKLGDGVTAWADLPYVSGPTGAVGVQGDAGPAGPAGADGAQGEQGPQGIQGVAGVQGEAGPAGPVGPQGDAGPQGLPGPAVPLSNSVTSESETDAASSKAVKEAFDKGISAAADAAAAAAKANAAQATADAAKAVTDTVSTSPTPHGIPRAGADGKLHAGWIGGGGGMIPAGHIAMLPFRYNQLPAGWYFCNGTRYNTTTTAVGAALKALPNTLKSDWGMSLSGSGASETIAVPNWFYGGRGPVMRAVDGSSRQVGSVEEDALQEASGNINDILAWPNRGIGGVLRYTTVGPVAGGLAPGGGGAYNTAAFALSGSARTSAETRMLNRGMTPAIFLGV